MSIVAGCDVGSLTTKAVLIKQNRVICDVVIRSGPKPGESANRVMDALVEKAGISRNDISCTVGTGYGREKMGFVHEAVSEISCHAKGAHWMIPTARTVIDIGGQDCKVMRIDESGDVVKFVTNDKCASGTGRFLDVMAGVMNIDVDRLGKMSRQSKAHIAFASMCTVWAQADVIKHINERRPAADIGAGINTAMANRVAMLANALHVEEDICMTGGVAKNDGVVNALSKILGRRIKRVRRVDPQLTGAVGAALFAAEKES